MYLSLCVRTVPSVQIGNKTGSGKKLEPEKIILAFLVGGGASRHTLCCSLGDVTPPPPTHTHSSKDARPVR